MTYIAKQINDTYVVWFAPANRYMQLQKPAFRVLEDWSNTLPEMEIIQNCSCEFKLPNTEARRFVSEVIDLLMNLIDNNNVNPVLYRCDKSSFSYLNISFSTKNYLINDKIFQFRFSNPELEDLIHPGFGCLENKRPDSKTDYCFDLSQMGHQLYLQVDGLSCWKFPESKQEYFIGQVYIQMLNCMYQVTDAHWMGAVHASAVSAGNGAVLFAAPSGSGKSTFAAMLMKEGYKVLSDDFSPLSLNQNKVYPFPESISVKNRSLNVLKPFYSSLTESGDSIPDVVRELFLPVTAGMLPEPAAVKAIVFLQYDSATDLDFKKISNLDTMDRFLHEMWLPSSPEVASSFLDWYFQVPCYSLNYSDTEKAIESVKELF